MSSLRLRRCLVGLWLVVTGAGLYLFLFHRDVLQRELRDAASFSVLAAGALYLAFGCLRGFTLIPSTTLVLAAVPFLPPWPLFALTLAGIVVSSASIYLFAGALGLEALFLRRHERAYRRLQSALERWELPVIVAWSFFPLAPTDLICYVCGVMRVDLRKCLLGVTLGEGAICAVYVFLGDWALRSFALR
jgi:uncharacterized membrane protein YdjX (TVP38/TMEM64 family)